MTDRQTRNINWAGWLARGALGGIAAGAAFLAATMWFATSVGDPAKGPLLMISTILKGDDAMMDGSASAGLGLAVHVGLSALFGLVFALLASRLRTNGALAVAGTLYGAALYVVNFKVLTPLAFSVFKMANQPFELVVHVVFGTLLSLAFFGLPAAGRSSRTEREAASAGIGLEPGPTRRAGAPSAPPRATAARTDGGGRCGRCRSRLMGAGGHPTATRRKAVRRSSPGGHESATVWEPRDALIRT